MHRKVNRKLQNLSPLSKMAENLPVVYIPLNSLSYTLNKPAGLPGNIFKIIDGMANSVAPTLGLCCLLSPISPNI